MAAAERNVGIRLQVIDGGKVKTELAAVGEAGAQALGALEQKSNQAAQAMNQLRAHEISNLSAQLSDVAVSLASGQSPFMVMVQQGAQVSQILGDRGIKAALTGVGTALLSMINPTTMVLAGILALGYGAAFVFDAMKKDTEDASEALERHNALIQRLSERYGDVEKAARGVSDAQRQIDLAEATRNAESMRKAYIEAAEAFAGQLTTSRIRGLGEVYTANPAFSNFSAPIAEFLSTVRNGEPDIESFRASVARMVNETDNPAIRKAGQELLALSGATDEAAGKMDQAAGAAERVASSLGISTEAMKQFSAAMKEWDANQRLIDDLDKRAATAGNDRQRYIDSVIGRLKNPTEDQLAEAIAAAGRAYDAEQRQREQEKRSREAVSEARREQNRVEREAQRIYAETRTAGEAYADTLARLNDLLQRGLIDQDTYSRAVGQAQKVMTEANRDALYEATDAASGYKRAVLDYVEAAEDMATNTEQIIGDALQGSEDAFVSFVTTGKMEFSDLVDSMIADLARLAFRQSIAPLLGGSTGIIGSLLGGFTGSAGVAGGDYFASGFTNSLAFGGPRASGGRVSAGSAYIVGERGPEPFVPTSDGYILPTEALRGAGAAPRVTVNVQTLPGTTADVGQPQLGADGSLSIPVMIRELVRNELRKDFQSRGEGARALERSYGLNPSRGRGR